MLKHSNVIHRSQYLSIRYIVCESRFITNKLLLFIAVSSHWCYINTTMNNSEIIRNSGGLFHWKVSSKSTVGPKN